jgi:hypothetical protein
MGNRTVLALTIAGTMSGQLSLSPAVVRAPRADDATARHAPAGQASDEAEILRLDQKIASAVVRGETAYVDSVTSGDFVMVHGDGWTYGGKPLSTDTKESMLKRVTSQYYDVLDFDSVKAEMHGDIAITYGRYLAHVPGSPAERAWFAVWYERVYAKRNGRWLYISHRTVHGPTYGPDRQFVRDKSERVTD